MQMFGHVDLAVVLLLTQVQPVPTNTATGAETSVWMEPALVRVWTDALETFPPLEMLAVLFQWCCFQILSDMRMFSVADQAMLVQLLEIDCLMLFVQDKTATLLLFAQHTAAPTNFVCRRLRLQQICTNVSI